MSLAQGREFLAIPGPSVTPDAVLQAMNRPSINIYEGEIVETTQSILRDLRSVARTTARPFIYIANGHGAWEAALTNTLSRGDTALVLESGRFALGWGEMAAQMGVKVEVLHAAPRRALLDRFAQHLAAVQKSQEAGFVEAEQGAMGDGAHL